MNFNYFTWIANLGVVPLFLLAIFLFAPAFLCFAFLRFSVTAVRDAIKCSSKLIKIPVLWALFLTFFPLKVKDFICFAQSNEKIKETILLSKGEQKILRFQSLKNFSIGNKSVIAHQWDGGKQRFFLKGIKIGFTDLLIWDNKNKYEYKIYVLSNNNFLKLNSFIETLKDLNLDLEIRGEIMKVRGLIKSLEDYKYLILLRQKFKQQIHFEVDLDFEIRNEIIGKIYQLFFDEGLKVNCEINKLQIVCYWQPVGHKKTPPFISQLESSFGITFIKGKPFWLGKNFKLKLKLIQTEQHQNLNYDLGLGIFKSSVDDLFKNGLKSLILNNQVLLQEAKLNIYSLAEPEVLITTNAPTKIEIGAQIPFQNINMNNNSIVAPISWRFAGLKIKTLLIEENSYLRLDYSTEFSKPIDNGISGSKKKSHLYIIPGKAYKIFQTAYQSDSVSKSGFPFLDKIPVLRSLFLSSTKEKSYKLLEGYLLIEGEE